MSFDFLSKIDIGQLMLIMEKYKEIDVKETKLKIEKYDNAIILKVISDSNKLGDIVSELLPLILGEIPEQNIEILDKRG